MASISYFYAIFVLSKPFNDLGVVFVFASKIRQPFISARAVFSHTLKDKFSASPYVRFIAEIPWLSAEMIARLPARNKGLNLRRYILRS